MNDRWKNLLLSPDAAGGGATSAVAGTTEVEGQGANDALEPAQETQQEGAGQEGQTQEQQGEQTTPAEETTTPAAATTSGITKEDVEEILRGVMPAALQSAQQQQQGSQTQQQPQMSQADFDRLFNVYKPDANLIALLRSEDPNVAVKALEQMTTGLIRQAMTMADYRIQQYRDQIVNEHINPLQAYVSEAQARSFRDDFFKKYPDLEPYEAIVDAVSAKVSGSGWRGKDRTDVMKRFADDTRQVVKSLLAKNGGTQAGTTPGNGSAPKGGKQRMSTLSNGGQGGSSRPAQGQQPQGPKGIEVFD